MKLASRSLVVFVLFHLFLITGCSGHDRNPIDQAVSANAQETVTLPAPNGSESAVPPVSESSKQAGPYYSLLKLDSAEVERRLGKPTTVTNLGPSGDNSDWRYDDLGLTLYVTTQRSNHKQIVTTLFQRKGLIVGTLSVGDSEEKATAVTGPVVVSSKGERIAQFVVEDAIFTLTFEKGQIVKARVEPVGRED